MSNQKTSLKNSEPNVVKLMVDDPGNSTPGGDHSANELTFASVMNENESLLKFGTSIYDFQTGRYQWSKGMFELYQIPFSTEKIITDALYQEYMHEVQYELLKKNRHLLLSNRSVKANWQSEILIEDQKEPRRIETFCRIIYNDAGQPLQMIETSRDITRLHNYEKDLEEKIEALDRSNKDLEEFAYVASHDLQEPLRKLTTFSGRLTEKFGDKLDAEGIDYLKRMVKVTGNMRMLINNLLNFSLISRSTELYEPTDLNKLVAQVISDLELIIDETGTQVIMDDLPTLTIIPSQISQLFTNLLSNAIKFRQAGTKPVISISCNAQNISHDANGDNSNVRRYYSFKVSDNGIGFEKEYAQRIFQIFQRLHGKAEYPGTGIGLSICKKIIDNHKGSIYADSSPGQGATFYFILPEH